MIPTIYISDITPERLEPAHAGEILGVYDEVSGDSKDVYARWVWPDGHDFYGILVLCDTDGNFWPDYEITDYRETSDTHAKMMKWASGRLNDLLSDMKNLTSDYDIEGHDVSFGGYPSNLFHYVTLKFFMQPDWNPS